MYDRIKGFRDVYPPEMAAQRTVIDTVESVARRYGFREIATPALERTQVYVEKSGEEIVDELYTFTDQGGRSVALTPELTPTVARMVVEKGQAMSKPIKWFSTRPFWRYEQVQQGRFREFYQTNVDIFGSAEPEADAEILAFAHDALQALDLKQDDYTFRVSHRDILETLLVHYGEEVTVADGVRAVDKREKLERVAYLDALVEAGLDRGEARAFDETLQAADENLDVLVEETEAEAMESAVHELRAVLAAADRLGAGEACEVSLSTARGLDYYTGVVFECFDTTGDVGRAIFGGGRYDDLIESVGGPPTPAVGVAPGVMNSTLPLLLKRAGVWPEEAWTTDYYVLTVGETREEAAEIVTALRAAGNVVETDLADRGFGAQLEYADTRGAETVIIVGERDLEEGMVTVKDMASGEQVQVPYEDVPGSYERPRYEDYAVEDTS